MIPASPHSTELAGYPSQHNVIFVRKFSILFLVTQALRKRPEEINKKLKVECKRCSPKNCATPRQPLCSLAVPHRPLVLQIRRLVHSLWTWFGEGPLHLFSNSYTNGRTCRLLAVCRREGVRLQPVLHANGGPVSRYPISFTDCETVWTQLLTRLVNGRLRNLTLNTQSPGYWSVVLCP
jgi:hypothetical protein